MIAFKILLTSVLLIPAFSAITSSQTEAQVYYNYNYCPAGMVQTYDPVYGNYVCAYPSTYGLAYSRPNISLGFYWGSGNYPYQYPAYRAYRSPYPRYSYGYNQRYQPRYGRPGRYR